MNVFPVIARELVADGRGPASCRQRVAAAAAAIGVMTLILSFHQTSTSNAVLSQRLLGSVCILGFAYALLASMFLVPIVSRYRRFELMTCFRLVAAGDSTQPRAIRAAVPPHLRHEMPPPLVKTAG